MTVIIKDRVLKMYYEKTLVASNAFRGKALSNEEDMYIGRGTKNNRQGVAGAGFDNIYKYLIKL